MNTLLDEFLTYHLLERKFSSTNSEFFDYFLANDSKAGDQITKNVCAKLSIPLSERIDEVCEMLGVSKRRFIETALIQAINRSEELFDEIQPFAHLEQEAAG